jgi:hypothetical protein
MFSWVCPRCGRDNSPSYTECPDCKERDLQAAAEAAKQPPPMEQPPGQQPPFQPGATTREWQAPPQPYQPEPQQQYAPPQQQYAPPQQQQYPPQGYPPPQQYPPQQQYGQPQYQPPYAPPTQYGQPQYGQQPPQPYASPQYQQPPYQPSPAQQQPQRPAEPPKQTTKPPLSASAAAPASKSLSALPVWLLMLLFAFAFLGAGAAIYYGYQYWTKPGPAGFTGGEQAAASKAKATNPLQKYIDVVGIRLTTDAKKKPVAKFLVVNHGNAELNGLSAIVTLWSSTSRSEEDAVGSFAFNLDGVGADDSKELSAPLKTKLKMYELPDWQNITAEVQITSPPQ